MMENKAYTEKKYRVAIKYEGMELLIVLSNADAERFITEFKKTETRYITVTFGNTESQIVLSRDRIIAIKINHDTRSNQEYLDDTIDAMR